jgi:hypothetical protein
MALGALYGALTAYTACHLPKETTSFSAGCSSE